MEDAKQFWRLIREPFYLPQSVHTCQSHDFENIDINIAGCVLCGRIHVCDKGHCELHEYDGRQVCEITGYCVRNVVYSQNEYVDTVVHVNNNSVHGNRGAAGYSATRLPLDTMLIETWVKDVVTRHVDLLQDEIAHNVARRSLIFTRILKHYKSMQYSTNIVNMLTCFVNATKNIREPRVLAPDELQRVAAECVSVVTAFCSRMFTLRAIPTTNKLRGFVIGVVYLMRDGLCVNDSVQLLPQLPVLNFVLPSETRLRLACRLSTKIMTETENHIKATLKGLSPTQLRRAGFG